MSFELPSSSPNSGRASASGGGVGIGGVAGGRGSGSGSGGTLRKRGMNLARSVSQNENVRKSVLGVRSFDMWRHVRKEYVGTSYPAMVSGTSAGGLLSVACGIVMLFLVVAEYAGHRSVYTTSAVVMNAEEDARFRWVLGLARGREEREGTGRDGAERNGKEKERKGKERKGKKRKEKEREAQGKTTD